MITETRKKTINGGEVEYLDVVHHITITKFKFWDRIKILFGKEVTTYSEIYTQNELCKVVGSEAKTHVAPLIKRKSVGMMHSCISEEIEQNGNNLTNES
jgi:hypothetical protein